jgi:hypothetical protein
MPEWSRREERAYDDVTDLAHPPNSGGWIKILLLGIALPLALAWYAWHGYSHEAIWWPGGRSGAAVVKGENAKLLALCYFAGAAAAHFRWLWGLLSTYRIFVWGTTLSLLLWIGGCGTLVYREFFY